MDDLIAFLRAQWDAEESDARWSLENAPSAHQTDPNSKNFSPERVLRDVAAKRRIVDACERRGLELSEINWAVRVLALPYADHDDYQEKWKP